MRRIYVKNIKDSPATVQKELLKSFDQHLSDPASHFYVFRYGGKITGSMCFTEYPDRKKYVSAFNVDPTFQGSRIGDAMIEQAMDKEAETNILIADCVATKSISARYIEKGFVAKKYRDDDGEWVLDIARDDKNGDLFKTKAMTQEELIRLAPLKDANGFHFEIADKTAAIDFDWCNRGYVLTRYFHASPAKGKKELWYAVFESRKEERKV